MTRKFPSSIFLIDIGLVLLVILTRVVSASGFLHKWDSVQFALALTDYDITRHQPHPPGYPGYIGLSWLVNQVIHNANFALVIVGIISAALLVVVIHRLGRVLIGPRGGPVAGLLTALNPLLWYFSSIAHVYMVGVAVASLAAWISYVSTGRSRWSGPLLAGVASVIWLPAGILVAPVCIWGYIRKLETEDPESENKTGFEWSGIISFIPLFLLPVVVGYIYPIVDTGGLAAYLAEVGSESGKHVLRFGEWLLRPMDEFLATTGSLANFFEQGLGKGRWLFLVLLVPITGEIGCHSKKVISLLPLMIVGFIAMHWSEDPVIRVAGILAFTVTAANFLPTPTSREDWNRRWFLFWWLVPGMLLFVLVYVNYVGILIIFLPPLILMEAWAIERAATFMFLQTLREGPADDKDGSDKTDEKANVKETMVIRDPDPKVEKFIAWVLIGLMILHDLGAFGNPHSQESLLGIKARDIYLSNVIESVGSGPIAEDELIILGGQDDYRHWTYYIPEARTIWTKYLLYNPVREGRSIWVSEDRSQEKFVPGVRPVESSDDDTGVLAAYFDINDANGIIVFPDEMELLRGQVSIMSLYPANEEDPEPICFLLNTGNAEYIVFTEGAWWLE